MFSSYEFDHSPFPSGTSDTGKKLASHLFEWYKHADTARSELSNVIWPACDDAYNMYRILPRNRAMVWADKSTQGESDLRDSVDFLVDALMVQLMGQQGAWMTPVSYKPEDQATQNLVRDYLAYKHNISNTRDHLGTHYNQLFRRGTSAYSLEWHKIVRMRRLDPAQSSLLIGQASQQIVDQTGLDPSSVIPIIEKQMKRRRIQEVRYNGPRVRALDMYDVILDPVADFRNDDDVPMATITYKTLDELKNAKDEDDKALYENLDDLTEWTPSQLYSLQPKRYRNSQAIGINPHAALTSAGNAFIPVLVFHRMYQKLDDALWVDSFFHVALSSSHMPRLIRSHENPSDYGHRDIFLDQYTDICNAAYGTGVVEKSLSNWQKKNIVSALALNAALVRVFPPLAVIADMLVDDRKIDVGPGGYNVIEYKPQIGTNFVAPLPIAQGGLEDAEQYESMLAQKIAKQTGAYGAAAQDGQSGKSKTATEANINSTTGSIAQQNFLEKVSRNLEPFAQAYYDACRQYEEDDMLNFIVIAQGGDPQLGQLSKEILDQDRRMVVTGFHAIVNRAAEMQNQKDALQILTTGNAAQILANAPLIIQDIVLTLLGNLGVRNLDKFREPAFDLIKKEPQFQQQMAQILQQLAQTGVPQQLLLPIAQAFLPPPPPQPGQKPGGPPQGPPQGQGAGAPAPVPQGGTPIPGHAGGPGGPQPAGLAVQGGQDVG
jgi:hypothetical protein